MTCKEVQRQLTESSSSTSVEIQDHVKGCEACRQLCRDLQSLDELSSELKRTVKDAPPFFASRVCSQVNSNRPRLLYVRLAAVLGAVVVVSVGIASLPGLYQLAGDRLTVHAPEQPAEPEIATQAPTTEVLWIDRDHTHVPSVEAGAYPVLIRENPSSGYQLEMPATIQVRQTQAENEFYLRNVSH